MSHEIARLLREIAYELIAIVVPGLVALAGVLLLLNHLGTDLSPLTLAAEHQPWLFGLVGLTATYALGQAAQATGHVFIYWLKIPWLILLALVKVFGGVQRAVKRAASWLYGKVAGPRPTSSSQRRRYFELLDVADDRAEWTKFEQSAIFAKSRAKLLELAGLEPTANVPVAQLRDLAMAALGPASAERHKFLNLSEFCIGMASALLLCAFAVAIEARHAGHAHEGIVAALAALSVIFMLRQPRYNGISEKIVFGQLLIKDRLTGGFATAAEENGEP